MKLSDILTGVISRVPDKSKDNMPLVTPAMSEVQQDSNEQIMFMILDNLKIGIVYENKEQKIILANKNFCDIFNIHDTPASLIGKEFKGGAEQYRHLFEMPFLYSGRIVQVIKQRMPVHADELFMLDGKILGRDYIPIFNNEQFKGTLWLYTDVTEKNKHDKDIKILVEQYKNVIANMNLGLLELDKNDIILSVNDIFCNISGYEKEELIGKKALDILQSDVNEKIFENKMRLKKHGFIDMYQVPIVDKNGQEHWWLISEAPNFEEKGNLTGSIGIHMDISAQKKMERELEIAKLKAEESAKAKEIFLANMSHEIRTPMTGIMGMVNLLNKTKLDEQQKTYSKLISESANNLLSIVNDVLDVEKISAGKIDIENFPFRLEDKVFKILQTFQFKAEEKNINLLLNSTLQPELIVVGDPYRLGQIITNLLNNAIKFTAEGEISITLESKKEDAKKITIEFHIKDSGIGIRHDKLTEIFKPFVQASTDTSRKFGGTGLGLTICKSLVEMQGGKISVASVENFGTTFSFYVPYEKGNEAMIPKETEEEINVKRLESIRILVAEDVEINQFLIKHILESWNCIVTIANNGREAVEKVRKHNYDIILMDIQMPEMDGITATKMIRTMNAKNKAVTKNMRTINATDKSAIPIIALTANALKGDGQRYLDYGMNGYVTKPFTEEKLFHALSNVIKTSNNPNIQPADITEVNITDETKQHEKLYDISFINAIGKDDVAFNKKFIAMFITSMKDNMQQLDDARKENDYNQISTIAHKMKSNIDSMGIASIKDTIRVLETNQSEYVNLDADINKIKKTLNDAFIQLQQFELND